MCEINITALFSDDVDLWPCYGSVATHGWNAAKTTWGAALRQSDETNFITEGNKVGRGDTGVE